MENKNKIQSIHQKQLGRKWKHLQKDSKDGLFLVVDLIGTKLLLFYSTDGN